MPDNPLNKPDVSVSQPIQPIQPISTDLSGTDLFKQRSTFWAKKAEGTTQAIEQTNARISALQQRQQEVARQSRVNRGFSSLNVQMVGIPSVVAGAAATKKEINQISDEMTAAMELADKQLYELKLYLSFSYTTLHHPGVKSVDELVQALGDMPSSATSLERNSYKQIASDIFKDITTIMPRKEDVGKVLLAGDYTSQPITAPSKNPLLPMKPLHQMAVEEMSKYIFPREKSTTMSAEEWDKVLEGNIQLDPETSAQASQLAAYMAEIDERRQNIQQGIDKMPSMTKWDMAKLVIVSPAIAVSDVVGWYSEKVVYPTAAVALRPFWGQLDRNITENQNEGEDLYHAASHAWEESKLNMWAKMALELPFDPASYLGWGIFAKVPLLKGTKLFKALDLGDKAYLAAADIPFDMFKTALEKFPKTVSQKSVFMTAADNRTLTTAFFTTMKHDIKDAPLPELNKWVGETIDFTLANPLIRSSQTDAGRVLLSHSPFYSGDMAVIRKILKTSETIPMDDKLLMKVLDDEFERAFYTAGQDMTNATGRILTALGVADNLVDNTTALAKYLNDRAAGIVARGKSAMVGISTTKSLDRWQKMLRGVHTDWLDSEIQATRVNAGRISQMFYDAEPAIVELWRRKIDEAITRPFARAYLTFGGYGPGNIVEDMWRSIQAGVVPGTKSAEEFQLAWKGVYYDQNLTSVHSISEMMGDITKKFGAGNESNWPIMLSLTPASVPLWAVSKGKITPSTVSNAVFNTMVVMPGEYGMAVRLKVIDDLATKNLRRLATAMYEELQQAVPKSGLKITNKTVQRALNRAIKKAAAQGDPAIVEAIGKQATVVNITHGMLEKALGKYPELHMYRQVIHDALDAGTIMKNVSNPSMTEHEAITAFINAMDKQLTTDFIKKPSIAMQQVNELATQITKMDLNTPQDLMHAFDMINHIQQACQSVPEQVMQAASVQSRGMKFAERKAFMDDAMAECLAFLNNTRDTINGALGKVGGRLSSQEAGTPTDILGRILAVNKQRKDEIEAHLLALQHIRSKHFGNANPITIKTREFWDRYYADLDYLVSLHASSRRQFDDDIAQLYTNMQSQFGISQPARKVVDATGRDLTAADVANILGCQTENLSKGILGVLGSFQSKDDFVHRVMASLRGDLGVTEEAVGKVYDNVLASIGVDAEKATALTSQKMQLAGLEKDLHSILNSRVISEEDMKAIQDHIGIISNNIRSKVKLPDGSVNPAFAGYNDLRQKAMDMAHKQYYKEFTDYTHQNMLDATMRAIYPFWTYESQRWLWLPRSFARHPSSMIGLSRYSNNNPDGRIQLPLIPASFNPFQGGVYGPWMSALSRQAFPEYFENLPQPFQQISQMNSVANRYGWYPGVIPVTIQALFSGRLPEWGSVATPTAKTFFNLAQATIPKSKAVRWLRDHIFYDKFQDYLTAVEVSRLGGDGGVVQAKRLGGEKLTPEEQDLWDMATRKVSFYSALFTQSGFLNFKPKEYLQAQAEAKQAIYELTNITPEEQDWYRKHGYEIWEVIGGQSLADLQALKGLSVYAYSNDALSLLSESEQMERVNLELAFDELGKKTGDLNEQKMILEQQFLAGELSRDAFDSRLSDLDKQRATFYNDLVKKYPLIDLTTRMEYYKRHGGNVPVLHPSRELANMYYNVKLEEMVDPITGIRGYDWDKYWSQKAAIDAAIPDYYRSEWEGYKLRNSSPLDMVDSQVIPNYIRKYQSVWDATLAQFNPEQQKDIQAYYGFKKTQTNPEEQARIEATPYDAEHTLLTTFQSNLSANRNALRDANPVLDAWLLFYGKVTSVRTQAAANAYNSICQDLGRKSSVVFK